MKVLWTSRGRADYDYWVATDEKNVEQVKALIADIKQRPFKGLGKPEPLKYDLSGWWSRRITREHRLVYRVKGKPSHIEIASCRYHY